MPINTSSIFSLNAECSEQLKEWLEHQDSLTDKLQHIKGNACIQLINQGWVHTDWWGKNLLQIKDKLLFQREILMMSHDIACWYARTIIPQKCYDRDPLFFDRLKSESIKNLIFGEDKVLRVHWVNYPIDNQCIEFYWVQKIIDGVKGTLWVKLAEFSFLESESFYLIEIMLPELERVDS